MIKRGCMNTAIVISFSLGASSGLAQPYFWFLPSALSQSQGGRRQTRTTQPGTDHRRGHVLRRPKEPTSVSRTKKPLSQGVNTD
jgi:hypothetical protein